MLLTLVTHSSPGRVIVGRHKPAQRISKARLCTVCHEHPWRCSSRAADLVLQGWPLTPTSVSLAVDLTAAVTPSLAAAAESTRLKAQHPQLGRRM